MKYECPHCRKSLQGGMLAPLPVGLAVLAAAHGFERWRLRDAPRYRKGRNEGWNPKLEPLE